MGERELSEDLKRSLERSAGFVLRPVELYGRAEAEALVAALVRAGHPAELVAPRGEEWSSLVRRLEARSASVPLMVYGDLPVDGAALAALNRGRDVVVDANPRELWWCGSDQFLAESARAMPDLWSIRAPAIVWGERPTPVVERGAPELMPQTEKDVRALAKWIVEEFGEPGVVLRSQTSDRSGRSQVVAFNESAIARAVSVLVGDAEALCEFVERVGRSPAPPWWTSSGGRPQKALELLGRLGAFDGAPPGRWTEWSEVGRGLIVPPTGPAPGLAFSEVGQEQAVKNAFEAPTGRRLLVLPTIDLAAAFAAFAGLSADRSHVVLVASAGRVRWLSLRTIGRLLHHRGSVVCLASSSAQLRELVEVRLPVPLTVTLSASLDPGPLPGWERYTLAPLNEPVAAELIAAWLPDPAEQRALVEFLRASPERAPVLTDLARLLPILHGFTRLPTRFMEP